MIRLLTSLHTNVTINFEVAGINKSMPYTIGVKQGDNLGPLLFLFYIAAMLITWKATTTTQPCIFKSAQDFKISGRNHSTQGELFIFRDSAYADDTAAAFTSREDASIGTNEIIQHFGRFGMEVHTGQGIKTSKSEILFIPKASHLYSDPQTHNNTDVTPIQCPNSTFVPVVDKFKYLGSHQAANATESLDIKERIKAASNAFGALRKCFFKNRNIALAAKSAIYKCLILHVALYASESWSMSANDERILATFHNSCVRMICRVSRQQQRAQYITTDRLLRRLKLPPIAHFCLKKQLRWAGHVARMPWQRLPRKLLTAWVNRPRSHGAPGNTYAKSLHKNLSRAGISTRRWHILAQDKDEWRAAINNIQ